MYIDIHVYIIYTYSHVLIYYMYTCVYMHALCMYACTHTYTHKDLVNIDFMVYSQVAKFPSSMDVNHLTYVYFANIYS